MSLLTNIWREYIDAMQITSNHMTQTHMNCSGEEVYCILMLCSIHFRISLIQFKSLCHWANNGDIGDLRRHRVHYEVIEMHSSNCWLTCFPTDVCFINCCKCIYIVCWYHICGLVIYVVYIYCSYFPSLWTLCCLQCRLTMDSAITKICCIHDMWWLLVTHLNLHVSAETLINWIVICGLFQYPI